MQQETIQTIQEVSTRVQYTGATGAVIFGVALEFWGVIFGLIVGVAGFLVNWYYRHKIFKLEKAKYAKEGITEPE
jgi:hypothetical protein